jgi:hypothetical protein
MSIEQHETELKELLTRVMRDPLQPLQSKIDQTIEDLVSVDQQLKALRDVDLNSLNVRLDGVEKILKRLRSWSEGDAASEFREAIMPPVQQALDTLGTRVDEHAESVFKPMLDISHEVSRTKSALERLSEHSAQGSALAMQGAANIGDQVRELSAVQAEQARLIQTSVHQAAEAAVENLREMAASANAAHEANLRRILDDAVTIRIDKILIFGRWVIGLAIVALSAAAGCLFYLMPPVV